MAVDKNVCYLVHKLKCLKMGITCVSEIKGFCKDAYEVDGFAVFHSVHDLPR